MSAAIAGVSAQLSRGLASRNRTHKRSRTFLHVRGARRHTMANCTYSPSSSENARPCASRAGAALCIARSMFSQATFPHFEQRPVRTTACGPVPQGREGTNLKLFKRTGSWMCVEWYAA